MTQLVYGAIVFGSIALAACNGSTPTSPTLPSAHARPLHSDARGFSLSRSCSKALRQAPSGSGSAQSSSRSTPHREAGRVEQRWFSPSPACNWTGVRSRVHANHTNGRYQSVDPARRGTHRGRRLQQRGPGTAVRSEWRTRITTSISHRSTRRAPRLPVGARSSTDGGLS